MKRYVVTVDFYLYAENDEDCIKQAIDFCKEEDSKKDNKCEIVNMSLIDFASISAIPVDFKNFKTKL